ncbi:hypothetical protein CEXT_2831 [Caerostris extrusa]|uniref:Uncharacterized protein n=1 Tax=Caerostris extrusa TaxID=172846 RepID=A0AAV4R2J6_CAEEX|nr:hypothetical protein CEXT_2831 [Caerostris extrusa]
MVPDQEVTDFHLEGLAAADLIRHLLNRKRKLAHSKKKRTRELARLQYKCTYRVLPIRVRHPKLANKFTSTRLRARH